MQEILIRGVVGLVALLLLGLLLFSMYKGVKFLYKKPAKTLTIVVGLLMMIVPALLLYALYPYFGLAFMFVIGASFS